MRYFQFSTFFLGLFVVNVFAGNIEQKILQHTLNDYIQPNYQNLVKATKGFEEKTNQLCRLANHNNLQESRDYFYQVVEAWGSIEWLRVGPVISNNRTERFFFFPDRKGIGLRQVQSILAKENPQALQLSSLQKMSVAVQGIGAAEYLLFGRRAESLEKKNSFRCRYIQTVAKNLSQMAMKIHQEWIDDSQLIENFLKPSLTNPNYISNKEAMNFLVGTLIHGLQAINDSRIGVFLRQPPKKDRPKSAPLWRSQSTMRLLTSNLQGLRMLFAKSQIATLLPPESDLENTIYFDFAQVIKTSSSLNLPISAILKDSDKRQTIQYLQLNISFLIELLSEQFSTATGLTTGFSYNDGD